MPRRMVGVALAVMLGAAPGLAQQPLIPGAAPAPGPFEAQPLPPIAPAAEPPRSEIELPAGPASPAAPPPSAVTPAGPPPAAVSPPAGRVFCEQSMAVQLPDPDTIAAPYRSFVGIWADASWTPQLCAALIVQSVAPDGTAAVVYVFGPMGAGARTQGGVLHGTGIIKDGELRFQNSDGSQFAFRPLYADLSGRLTTPQGQSYNAVFKRAR